VTERILYLTIVGLIIAAVAVLLWLMARASRSKARRPPWVGATGWAMLFLTSGRMPPPPPASQIEVDLSGEKDRNSSRSIDED
jgi:hypothetical protein